MRWRTPHSCKKDCVAFAANSGPPSLDSSSGTPKVAKNERKWRIRPAAPAWTDPAVDWNTSTQPDSLSPTMRYWWPPYLQKSATTASKGVDGGGDGRGGVAAAILIVSSWRKTPCSIYFYWCQTMKKLLSEYDHDCPCSQETYFITAKSCIIIVPSDSTLNSTVTSN